MGNRAKISASEASRAGTPLPSPRAARFARRFFSLYSPLRSLVPGYPSCNVPSLRNPLLWCLLKREKYIYIRQQPLRTDRLGGIIVRFWSGLSWNLKVKAQSRFRVNFKCYRRSRSELHLIFFCFIPLSLVLLSVNISIIRN